MGVHQLPLIKTKSKISGLNPSGIGALLAHTLKSGGDVSALLSEIAAAKAALAAEPRPLKAGFDPSLLADQSQLCERREYLIDAMYDDEAFQCVQTGRRFAMRWELDAHLDKIQARRQKNKEVGIARSRTWFLDAASWAWGAATSSETTPVLFAREAAADAARLRGSVPCSVLADESQPHCAVSGERFEVFWHHEEQDWYYTAAMILERPFGNIPKGAIVLANAVS